MRDMRYMRDMCDMLHGGTCFYILLIYPIYRAKAKSCLFIGVSQIIMTRIMTLKSPKEI